MHPSKDDIMVWGKRPTRLWNSQRTDSLDKQPLAELEKMLIYWTPSHICPFDNDPRWKSRTSMFPGLLVHHYSKPKGGNLILLLFEKTVTSLLSIHTIIRNVTHKYIIVLRGTIQMNGSYFFQLQNRLLLIAYDVKQFKLNITWPTLCVRFLHFPWIFHQLTLLNHFSSNDYGYNYFIMLWIFSLGTSVILFYLH